MTETNKVDVEPVTTLKHVETAIIAHCKGGDLWTCSMLAAQKIDSEHATALAEAQADVARLRELLRKVLAVWINEIDCEEYPEVEQELRVALKGDV